MSSISLIKKQEIPLNRKHPRKKLFIWIIFGYKNKYGQPSGFYLILITMVIIILDDNSEIGVHVCQEIGNITCLRHLFKRISYSKQNSFPSDVRNVISVTMYYKYRAYYV